MTNINTGTGAAVGGFVFYCLPGCKRINLLFELLTRSEILMVVELRLYPLSY